MHAEGLPKSPEGVKSASSTEVGISVLLFQECSCDCLNVVVAAWLLMETIRNARRDAPFLRCHFPPVLECGSPYRQPGLAACILLCTAIDYKWKLTQNGANVLTILLVAMGDSVHAFPDDAGPLTKTISFAPCRVTALSAVDDGPLGELPVCD